MLQRRDATSAMFEPGVPRFNCLGVGAAVAANGKALPLKTRKARALLAYLLLSPGATGRERAADLLWSDRGAEQARSSLRQAIYELRGAALGAVPLIQARGDGLHVEHGAISTDLSMISAAAKADRPAELLALLEGAREGFLTGLDGLDPEYDDWLRQQRAREPSHTLSLAQAAAERASVADPVATAAIAIELLRLDPTSENAARLAMRLAHQRGDQAAVHRVHAALAEALASDLGASPSSVTQSLFAGLTNSTAADESSGETVVSAGATVVERQRRRWTWIVAAVVVASVIAIAAFLHFRGLPGGAVLPPPLVAVLPFDPQDDTSKELAEGLWDDTRLALSQTGAVRVLGRTTSAAIEADTKSPQALRQRFRVDYLLAGGVRIEGSRVHIVVSLTRATDGLSVWEQSFDGRLGDALALQLRIAREIEGRIRGRLAPGGGTVAGQIRTSPDVYSLYADARALIRQRSQHDIEQASVKLRQAVVLDPNYAPAWASLATTALINRQDSNLSHARDEAIGQARRAIQLAPNLAEGYAALAFVQGPAIASSEGLLQRAVTLNPDNGEAWNWLGNQFMARGLIAKACEAWERAATIDPYYLSPMINLIRAHSSSGEADRARAVVEKVARTRPSQAYLDILRADLLINEGDYAKAVALVRRPQRDRQFDDNRLGELGDVWLRLGNPEETGRVWDAPSWFASAVRGEMIPPLVLRGQAMRPRDFWVKPNYGVFAARAILQRGRADLLVKHYRDAFNNPREFVATLQNFDSLDSRALSLAMALMKQRERAEASVILTTVEGKWREVLARSPNDRVTQVYLARVRAIRGDRVEALNLLTRARGRRWLPDGIADPIDIAQDPAFETLVGNPAFEAVRRTILGYVARERREAAALPRYP